MPRLPSTTATRESLGPAPLDALAVGAERDGPAELERKLARIAETAQSFARTPLSKKIAALAEVRARLHARGHQLAKLGTRAKGIADRPGGFGEELLAGAVIIQRYVRLLSESLQQIRERGAPHVGDDRVQRLPSGDVLVRVMPRDAADRLLFMPYDIDVQLSASVDTGDLRSAQASFYRSSGAEGALAVVLGGGNVASIPALDVLHQCFVEGRACVLKMSPVNAYLGGVFEHIFAPIAALGGLCIVQGGVEVGKALLASPYVDHVHMTGSIETHDNVVWGPAGPEREQRQRRGRPLLGKSITSELGNISPVALVPGAYSERELDDAAESVAGMLFNNASFNCNAAKLLVLPSSLLTPMVERLERLLSEQPARPAYYPGAAARYHELVQQSAQARVWAAPAGEGELPWTLLTGLTPSSGAPTFRIEPFCPLLTVVEIAENDPIAYLAQVVHFLNDEVWGTLNAMLLVPSSLEGDPPLEAALERTVAELRYGTVAINYWPAIGYGTGTPPWGGHPSSSLVDAQSGIGFVHNALMLERVQKVVLRGPLRSFPKQFYYPSHRRVEQLARALFEYESTGSALQLARTALHGLRG